VKFKPAAVSGSRALALAFVDCRTIQDRLDDVLGVAGWQDSYRVLPDGSVMCRLRCFIGGQWITKSDVGGQSEQADGGDRMKAAVSDALKRCAVKFGVGRFLYRLPAQWCDFDPKKKCFVRTPTLPAWAVPATPASESAAPASAKAVASKKPAVIGGDGAMKLIALASSRGRAISSYLPSGVDSPGQLTASQARTIWRTLSALPEVPAAPAATENGTGHNGTAGDGDPVDLAAAAAGRRPPVRKSSVPF
jgi:hypothetical protein